MDKYFTSTFEYSPVDQARNIANKRRVMAIMRALAEEPSKRLPEIAQDGLAADIALHVTHPVNELRGIDAGLEQLWLPLRRALPDMERREVFLAGGRYRDADWVACMGHYLGNFEQDLLGIPATRGAVCLRYCEGHQLRDGKIVESYLFLDFLDLMRQAGYWPLAPSLGRGDALAAAADAGWGHPDAAGRGPLALDHRDDSEDACRAGLLQRRTAHARGAG